LGLCYRKLTNLEEARRRWDECGKTTTNPDYSQAAIFSMVEIQLVDNKHHAEALQYLTQVVRDIKTPTDWHNAVIEVGQVRDAFEQCISKFSEAHEYDLAVKLTEPYECLAPPGRTSLLRAQIHAQWGRDCRKPPPAQPDATPVAPDEEKARDHLCQAGDNYARTAEVSADPAARADLLWEAILCYREAPNNAQAIVMLRSFAKAYPRDAKRISECWYLLGETYRLEKNDVEAEKAYQNCITSDVPNHFIYLAKHQVARYLIQRNQLDNAEELLEQSLKDLRLQPDAEPLEQTLFTLGEIAFRKHKYNAVVLKLAEAVFKDESRKNPMIVRAHYYLAESYYELATIENSNAQQGGDKLDPRTYQHYLEQYRMYMTKAGQVFDTLACMLEEQPEASNQFPDELKDKVKIEIPFKAADCSFFLGKYDEALKRYEALATKYEKTLDGLTALGGTVRCLASLHRDQDMMKRLQEIEKGLDVIQDPKTREAWQKWVKIASQRPAASGDPR
jgi:tetratricopeptide (TPR) repeat protein